MLCIGDVCRGGPSCTDTRLDGDETDVDCGGSCAPCPQGKGCKANRDCSPLVCRMMRCQSVTPRTLAFAAPVAYPAKGSPRALSAGDIDGDGKADIVVSNAMSIFLLLGSVKDPLAFQWMHGGVIGRPALTLMKVDGDNLLDFVIADGSATAAAYLNDGKGGFRNQPAVPIVANTGFGIAHADFNADGWDDIAVAADASRGDIAVVLNDGMGGFKPPMAVHVGVQAYGITAGDFDRDGLPDIAVVIQNPDPDSLQVILNRSR